MKAHLRQIQCFQGFAENLITKYNSLLNLLKQVKSQSKFTEETNVEDNKSTTVKKTVKSGITFGSALAMVISYTTWKSVGWAIFHGLLSWVYVIYFLLRY